MSTPTPSALSAPQIKARKHSDKLVMLTAYDYPTAMLAEQAGVDIILVGDSLGMVVLGYPDTLSVTLDDMIHHARAVSRGATRTMLVGDMPFGTYESGPEDALKNAVRLVQQGNVRAVKMEGGRTILPQVTACIQAGIPVMGHVGLTPQRVAELGGFKVQAKTAEAAREMMADVQALAQAGCFAIVLEAIPAPLASYISAHTSVPTIGIGAGNGCDGQVLVIHDLIGLYDRFVPKFVKQYAQTGQTAVEAITTYVQDVRSGAFPGPEHSFGMEEAELAKLVDDEAKDDIVTQD